MAETILSEYGYQGADGQQRPEGAGDCCRATTSQVDLVVTDLVMPSMGGRELVERIRQLAPEMTDFMHERLCFAAGQANRARRILQKPFTSAELLAQSEAGAGP